MDLHRRNLDLTEGELERASLLLEAFMLPNRAVTQAEKDVLNRAARMQAEHDASCSEDFPGLPGEVSGFQIGHFQMTLREHAGMRTSICPSAYALLLREGLLYRGIEGRQEKPETPPTAKDEPPAVTRAEPTGLPPLRPGVRPRKRDAWLPHKKAPSGNPPPQGVPPQGEPPLPGLPTGRRR